jgi:hypothetical protein
MKTLELVFTTAGGGTARLSVPEPVLPVNQTEINRVMDLIITRNVFETNTGAFSAKKAVRVVDHAVTDIPLS